jgi:hypothetical protein
MGVLSMYRWLFCLLSIMVPFSAAATENVGEIVRHEGKVVFHRGGGVRGENLTGSPVPVTVAVGDHLVTRGDGRAWLLLGSADRVLLKEDSSLKVLGIERAGLETGTVLFDIRKRAELRGVQIVTPTVTIGVKGTRFAIVGGEEGVAIYLRAGELLVEAVEGEFRKRRHSLREEFEATREAMQAEFKAGRDRMHADFERVREAMQGDEFETLRAFHMEPDTAFGIIGREVRPLEFPDWLVADFELLEQFPAGE